MDFNRYDDMMDKTEIKESGILEQYLLGELPENKQKEVESLLAQYEDLRAYYNQIEEDFEKLAFENAITPSPGVKTSLLNSIINEDTNNNVPVLETKEKKPFKVFMAVAASITIFFMISSGFLYLQWQQSKDALQLVQTETSTLQDKIADLENNLNQTNTWYQAVNNPNTIKLIVKGNDISPTSNAVTYINHKEKTVLLNAKGLAQLDDEHSYQMWADVEGEMINMGVIKPEQEMIAMNYIDHAESINITIEPKGGSEHPTVERLIGNVLL